MGRYDHEFTHMFVMWVAEQDIAVADHGFSGEVVFNAFVPAPMLGDSAFSEDDTLVATASSAAAGGHPLLGIAWLARRLSARGHGLHTGELIFTGGLTAATPLRPGHALVARFDGDTAVGVQRPTGESDAVLSP